MNDLFTRQAILDAIDKLSMDVWLEDPANYDGTVSFSRLIEMVQEMPSAKREEVVFHG